MTMSSLKPLAKRLAFGLLRYGGVAALARNIRQRNRVTILFYHDPDAASFERHMRLLSSMYTIIPLGDYVDAVGRGSLRDLPPKPMVVTFDDGWAGNRELLPVFRSYGIRPTIFVSTSIVGTDRHFWWTECEPADRARLKTLPTAEMIAELRAMGFEETKAYPKRQALSIEELDELRPYVDFQLHGRFHPILPNSDDDRARDEILGGRDEFVRLFGVPPTVLAYPNGDFSEREVNLAEEAGLGLAVTITPGSNSLRTPPYALRRMSVSEAGDDLDLLVVAVAGVYSWLKGVSGRSPGATAAR
jgi:peptidoglycan/xylan/chitin deacetylase (PgdA/CDA1 family)